MQARLQRRGFSLVEVVIAVGVFAVGVTVMLALLPSVARQGAEAADRMVAERLVGATRVELENRATRDGFEALAGAIPLVSSGGGDGYALVASHNGARIAAAGAVTAALPDEEQYFRIDVWRFAQAPLAYQPGGASLVVYVRISWPYRVRGAPRPVNLADRNQFTWATAINR